MTDSTPYRSTTNTCPSCSAPLREFAKRLVCDQCAGIMIGTKDFNAACEDVAGIDLALEIHDDTKTEIPCPRCGVAMANAKVTLADKKLKSKFLHCERDGLWCAVGVLTGVFAIIGRTWGGAHASSRGAGSTTGLDGLPVPQHRPASGALAISNWGDRPRRRPRTVTPVNIYSTQALGCPACPIEARRELLFAGDRWGCAGCHGAFVERGALEALVEEMANQPFELAAPSGAAGTRPCPVCTQAMIVEQLGVSTTIDRCEKHGVWFDEHELQTALVEIGIPEKTGLVGWLKRLF
jgi:Zn-finger nucleic acid-binding protein